jgi:4-hydroxybenzoate polyprenyltransferase
MTLLYSFFKLIRWPNLVFITLTQFLFFFCIAVPVTAESIHPTREMILLFYVLCLSSVLIAAGGYIINDYFDLNIDLVNKPERMVVDKAISRRWAIFFHFVLSMSGILLGFYIGLQNGNWIIGFANIVAVVVLWFYSTYYKKRLLSGNLMISALTGWVVMVVYVHVAFHPAGDFFHTPSPDSAQKFLRLAFLYTAFAFIITLVREVVKDIEDIEGDRKYGCRTVPIVWGVDFAKIFAQTWLLILVVLLGVVVFYILNFKMWVSSFYSFFFVLLPSVYAFLQLRKALGTSDFSKISGLIKLIMLAGILSMVLYKYFG